MKIRVNGLRDPYALFLGVQTNSDRVAEEAHRKARVWAPKRARSYSLVIRHTTYDGSPAEAPTGYAEVEVTYYTTATEGAYKI